MGNRAVITLKDDTIPKEDQLSVYLHWNGGLDSVKPLLRFCQSNLNGLNPMKHVAEVASVAFGGTHVVEPYNKCDTDNYDNGVYFINGYFEMIGREHMRNEEQQDYDPEEMYRKIKSAYANS